MSNSASTVSCRPTQDSRPRNAALEPTRTTIAEVVGTFHPRQAAQCKYSAASKAAQARHENPSP
jgi:hypothetical protein